MNPDPINVIKKNLIRKISEIKEKEPVMAIECDAHPIYVMGFVDGSTETLSWFLKNINDLMEEQRNND